MRFPLLLLFIITSILSLDAQRPGGRAGGGQRDGVTFKIKGVVTDESTNAPMEFATVSILSKRDSSIVAGGLTDFDGAFLVEAKPGPMYAVVEFIGYAAKTIDIEIDRETIRANQGVIDLGLITVSAEGIELEGVTVRAEKSETQFSLDKRIFNVGKDLANQGGSAQDILDNVPSVTVDLEGAVSLRGSGGVRILIDGKPSGLANQDNANGLRSIPANLIESVEVITNPSSRYEAEGMAGIINIILKKDKGSGFNGSFDVNAGYPEQAGLGANVNYRKGKVNWFANYGLNYRTSPGFGFSYQERALSSGTFFQTVDRDIDRSGLSNSVRFGIDYFPSDKETLTGSLVYRKSDDDNFGLLQYNDYIDVYPGNLVAQTLRTDNELEDESNLQYSLSYRKEYSSRKHTLEATVSYQDNIESETSDFFESAEVYDGRNPIADVLQRSGNAEGEKQWLFQLDFKKPVFDKGNFEFGVRSSLRGINNDYKVEQQFDGEFQSLPGLTNIFDYDENVHAAYTQLGTEWGKLSAQFGLRAELSEVTTLLITTNELNDRNYFNLFPSAFINYGFDESNSIQVNYSRRIRRPRFWDLNPFFTFSDSRNTFSGNPNLDPEFTDSYEVNYIKYWDELTVSGGVFYRHTTDVIQRVLSFNDDGTTNRQPENLATGDDVGLELTFQYSGLDWFKLDGNANLFRQQVNGSNVDNNFSADNVTWFARLTPRITLWKGSDLQLRFNYRAPRETVQGKTQGIASLDIGWSKDILQKSGTLTLSIRDLFNSRVRQGETFGEGFYQQSEFQWRARSFNLAFNYRINQKKQRQRSDRDGGDFEGGGEF